MSDIISFSAVAVVFAAGSLITQAQTAASSDQYSTGHALITEYPTPSAESLPQGLDIDACGNIWYTETTAGKIAVLRTTSRRRSLRSQMVASRSHQRWVPTASGSLIVPITPSGT